MADSTGNAHFVTIGSWLEVETATGFPPLVPTETLGRPLQALRLFVRDHKMRQVPRDQQSLEAHYGAFVLSPTEASTGNTVWFRSGGLLRAPRVSGEQPCASHGARFAI